MTEEIKKISPKVENQVLIDPETGDRIADIFFKVLRRQLLSGDKGLPDMEFVVESLYIEDLLLGLIDTYNLNEWLRTSKIRIKQAY